MRRQFNFQTGFIAVLTLFMAYSTIVNLLNHNWFYAVIAGLCTLVNLSNFW